MTSSLHMQDVLGAHQIIFRKLLRTFVVWLFVLASMAMLYSSFDTVVYFFDIANFFMLWVSIAVVFILAFMILIIFLYRIVKSVHYLRVFKKCQESLVAVTHEESVIEIGSTLSAAKLLAKKNHLVHHYLTYSEPLVQRRMTQVFRSEMLQGIVSEEIRLNRICRTKIRGLYSNEPLIVADKKVEISTAYLLKAKSEIQKKWAVSYDGFSWWNKFKYANELNFTEIDKCLESLSLKRKALNGISGGDIAAVDEKYLGMSQRACSRLATAKLKADEYVALCEHTERLDSSIIKKSIWLSAMSIPVSIWGDVERASGIYETLRRVNGEYAELSDTAIFLETLILPAESLVGLTSLVKGAYFEELVASDFDGVLFEKFNNPDVDIVIDGVGYQIKATGSASYVNSVDADIPVISTTEVVEVTDSIDGGYSDEYLTGLVDSALGGSIVDIDGTAVDAFFTGLGG